MSNRCLASARCLPLWTPLILASMQPAHRSASVAGRLCAVHSQLEAGCSLAACQPVIRALMQTLLWRVPCQPQRHLRQGARRRGLPIRRSAVTFMSSSMICALLMFCLTWLQCELSPHGHSCVAQSAFPFPHYKTGEVRCAADLKCAWFLMPERICHRARSIRSAILGARLDAAGIQEHAHSVHAMTSTDVGASSERRRASRRPASCGVSPASV